MKSIVNDLIAYDEQQRNTLHKMQELAYRLEGVEFYYRGNNATIVNADVIEFEVTFLIEEDGDSWNETISIFELEELIK